MFLAARSKGDPEDCLFVRQGGTVRHAQLTESCGAGRVKRDQGRSEGAAVALFVFGGRVRRRESPLTHITQRWTVMPRRQKRARHTPGNAGGEQRWSEKANSKQTRGAKNGRKVRNARAHYWVARGGPPENYRTHGDLSGHHRSSKGSPVRRSLPDSVEATRVLVERR